MRSTPRWIETLYSKFDAFEPLDGDGRSLGVRRYVVRPVCEEELKALFRAELARRRVVRVHWPSVALGAASVAVAVSSATLWL